MLHLIYIISKPPYLRKMSDCLESDKILKNYFDSLGGLLVKLTAEPFLQKCILNIIHNYIIRDSPQHKSIVSVQTCLKALGQSSLSKNLTKILSMNLIYNISEILHIIDDIITLNNDCCLHFLKNNLHNILLLRLKTEHFNTEECHNNIHSNILDLIIHTLWLLLKFLLRKDQESQNIKPPYIIGFRHLLNLLKGDTVLYRTQTSKHYRNDIATIVLQLVLVFPNINVTKLNILEDLVSFAAISKHETEIVLMTPHISNDSEDFIFKKLMLSTVWTIILNSSKQEVIQTKTEPIMSALLDCLVPWNVSKFIVPWNKEQLQEFLEAALKIIPMLIPSHSRKFVLGQGIQRMMDLLELYKYDTISIDLLQWVAKSVNRTLDLLFKMSEDQVDQIKSSIKRYIRPKLIIGLCRRILHTDAMSLSYQQILTNLLCTLQLMLDCNSLHHAVTEIKSDLLELVLCCLDRIISPHEEDSLLSNRLQITVADLVWSFVMNSPVNNNLFTRANGIYKILDTLQICLFPIKNIFLSILVDICEDASCIPYLLTWRRIVKNKNIGIMNMLCKFWRYQEDKDKVKRDKDGCIEDYERPLMGPKQFELFLRMGENDSSPAILYMMGNVRPKIYAIVQFIEERHKDVTQLVYEVYGPISNLSIQDEITLLTIRNFYKFKCGEIWQELDGDYMYRFPPLMITPTYRDIIHKLTLKHLNWSQHIQLSQKKIVGTNKHELDDEANQLFITHNDSQIAPAMKALREICSNARVENISFLTDARNETENQIKNCRADTNIYSAIPSYPQNLILTTMTAGREKILMHKSGDDMLPSLLKQESVFTLTKEYLVSPSSSAVSLRQMADNLNLDAMKVESLCNIRRVKNRKTHT